MKKLFLLMSFAVFCITASNAQLSTSDIKNSKLKFPDKSILCYQENRFSNEINNNTPLKLVGSNGNTVIEGVYEFVDGISYIKKVLQDIFVLNYRISNDSDGKVLSFDKKYKKNNPQIELISVDINQNAQSKYGLSADGNKYNQFNIPRIQNETALTKILINENSCEYVFTMNCYPNLGELQFVINHGECEWRIPKSEVQKMLLQMYKDEGNIDGDRILTNLFTGKQTHVLFDVPRGLDESYKYEYNGSLKIVDINHMEFLDGNLTLDKGEILSFRNGLLANTKFSDGKEESGDWLSKYNPSNKDYSYTYNLNGLTNLYRICVNDYNEEMKRQNAARLDLAKLEKKKSLEENPTPYVNALRSIAKKFISRIEYGCDDGLSALQEVLIEKQIYCQDDAARVMAEYGGKIALTWPRKKVEELFESLDKEFKGYEKLKTDRDL